MDRYIFILRKDEKNLDQVFSWIKGLLPKFDNSTKNKVEKPLLQWIPVTQDFGQVCSASDLCHWIEMETLVQRFEDKTLFCDDDANKQELETYLHDTADSIPCIGYSVQMYLFLHADDFDSEESFIPFAGAVMRYVKWLHVHSVVVKMESELSVWGHQLTGLTSGKVVSITECPRPSSISWSGKVSVTDEVTKEGVVIPGFYISYPQWNDILRQMHRPPPREKPTRRVRGRKDQVDSVQQHQCHVVCGHTIEVLQEVDLRTFPLFLLSPWFFYLNCFCDSGNSNDLVEYIHGKICTGLVARIRVYQINGNVPQCGDTNHLSASAWRDFVIGESPGTHIDHVPSSYEYLHLLILPNPDIELSPSSLSSPSSSSFVKRNSLRVRVLSTAKELAKSILSFVKRPCEYALEDSRRNQKHGDNASSKNGKKLKDEGQDENLDCIKSLPVYKAEDFLSTLQAIGQHQHEAREKLTNGQDVQSESAVLGNILKKMLTNGRTLGDEIEAIKREHDWTSEAAYGLSECPEWRALVADSHGNQGSEMDALSTDSGQSSAAALSKQRSFQKTGSKEFGIDHIISLLKEDDYSRLEAKLNTNPFRRLSTDSVIEGVDIDKSWKRHDIYHYNTEEDYDSEARYAQIRDRGDFQDTQSSFVTPKKKAIKPFHAVLPTRSSPRTKLFNRKVSSSKTPPKQAENNKSTFKHPQSFHGSSSSSQRKRPHSSLTPDSSYPQLSHRSMSSSVSQKRPALSLTPEIDQLPSSSTASSSHRKHLTPDLDLSQSSYSSASSLLRKRPSSSSFTPELEPNRPFKFARTSTPSPNLLPSLSSLKSEFEPAGETSPIPSQHSSSSSSYKRVPFTTVLDMPESGVRRSPRKLPNSQSVFSKSVKVSKSAESLHRRESAGPSNMRQRRESTPADTSTKMKRSERHMMRLKSIIAKVLMEKGVGKDDPIYQACSKNLLNVSIVLLKSLPNSRNLTDEMKSVVYGQVQQIINLEKRRSGIAL